MLAGCAKNATVRQKMSKLFDLKTAKCGEFYRLPDGREFEFRYKTSDGYNFILVLFPSHDAYLVPDQHKGAVLVEGEPAT